MKKYILSAICSFIVATGFGQPVVYFNFVTHNEETPMWNNAPYYNNNRARLVSLADYFDSKGITWNMQSDWVYLANVLTKETPALKATTNNKNILLWMQDDKGVEMDPHAHESQYIYPDVVKLMDSIGLTESKIIGGTIYNDSNGINIWTNLVNGQYGKIFPGRFWKPDYMMGGGTPNHVADIKYYGIWNPQSPAAYLVHDTLVHLRHVGVGCSIKIQDTTSITSIVTALKELIQNVGNGNYPADGFYIQTIFFGQAGLNDIAFYNKVLEVADSANAIVATGKAQWKTFKQAYTEWETNYAAKMFQWDCGQLTSIENTGKSATVKVYPNPASGMLTIETTETGLHQFSLWDMTGRKLQETIIHHTKAQSDISHLAPGLYIYQLSRDGEAIYTGRVAVQ